MSRVVHGLNVNYGDLETVPVRADVFSFWLRAAEKKAGPERMGDFEEASANC